MHSWPKTISATCSSFPCWAGPASWRSTARVIAGLSATDPWDLSKAQTIGRQKIRRIARFFKTYRARL